MTVEGIRFVTDSKKEQEAIFAKNLVKLSKMISDGQLSSSNADKVFDVMRSRHEKTLASIDVLGEMI